jgi:hypothetical protein
MPEKIIAPISVYTNKEYGIEALVYFHDEGFSVILRDIDANAGLDTIRIFPTVDDAGRYARMLVYSNGGFDSMEN